MSISQVPADKRDTIGGNLPPLSERLAIDHADLAQKAADVLALEALPPIMVDEDLALYSERAKALKDVAGAIEKARKTAKDQVNKDGRTIEDFFKGLAGPVTAAADAIVGEINARQLKRLQEQRKAEAEAAAARRQEEQKAKEAALALGQDDEPATAPPPPPPPVAAKEVARVVSSAGRVTASATIKWAHEIVDASLLPRDLLMPNPAAIKARVEAFKANGTKIEEANIPGVRIYEDLKTAIR
ncbi:hypothetical protein [Reyranella sp.]|uniref:hypothetical protein n=1 Tax=Reyranella sp. TaxID=1929291 RepID=UPI0040367ED6